MTMKSRSAALPDATGALPSAGDRVALRIMRQFDASIRSKLLYPSTIRTTLLHEFRMPWHWMWTLHYTLEGRQAKPIRSWTNIDQVLAKYAIWTGLLELCPGPDLTYYIFVGLRTKTDPRYFFIELIDSFPKGMAFRPRAYSPKRGPGYYLRDIRHPCARIGDVITDKAPTIGSGDANVLKQSRESCGDN